MGSLEAWFTTLGDKVVPLAGGVAAKLCAVASTLGTHVVPSSNKPVPVGRDLRYIADRTNLSESDFHALQSWIEDEFGEPALARFAARLFFMSVSMSAPTPNSRFPDDASTQ